MSGIRIIPMVTDAESDGYVSASEMKTIARSVHTNAAGKMTDANQFQDVQILGQLLRVAVPYADLASKYSLLPPEYQAVVRKMPEGSYLVNGVIYEGIAVNQLAALSRLSYAPPPKENHTTRNVLIGAALGSPLGLAGTIVGGWIGSWF